MKIISRFMLNDNITGYVLDDGGLTYPVTDRGLYDQDILEGLIKEGYKILNYHGDIMTPEGISIKDLIESPCTATEDEIQTMLDMADYALSEVEATKYFSRDVDIQEIMFKEPNVTIQTREELVAYLEKCAKLTKYSSVGQDVRPLNSFVAREALFTAQELASNPEVKDLFKAIERRRKLQSYSAFNQLIKFLQEEGVLGEIFTADDIKAAYLSWGICGLKTPVINNYIKIGVTTDILAKVEAVDRNDSTTGRVKEICLLDKKGVIHYSGGEVDLSDVDDFSQEIVTPMYDNAYYDALRSTSKWNAEYHPIVCAVSQFKTRSYYEMIDDNGVSYAARVDNNRLAIFDVRGVIHTSEFLFVRCQDAMYATIDKVCNKDLFQKWTLVTAKARDLVRNKTVKSPINDSFKLLISEGVTPEAAVRYIARRISDDTNLNADHQTGIDYSSAHIIYREGPDDRLIRKYNPNDYEYTNIDSLIDIMCSTRDEMEEKGEYLLVSNEDKGPEADLIREEISLKPLENLEFVKLVKEGNITIDNLYQGKMADGYADTEAIASLIDLVVRLDVGKDNIPIQEYIAAVANVEESNTIDFDSVIKVRNATYKGYLHDKAVLNATRAAQATSLVYITRVFRELANLPVKDQRHYMFECISIPVDKNSQEESALFSIASAIRKAINDTDEIKDEIKKIISLEAPSIAAKLMFKIIVKQINIVGSLADNKYAVIEEKFNIDGENVVSLKVVVENAIIYRLQHGKYLNRKYCTINDWCAYEMSPNSAFNLYCLNANITPWEVVPKIGVKIPVYSFGINYIKQAVLEQFSETFRNKVATENAKVGVIADSYLSNSLLEGFVIDETVSYGIETINTVLEYEVEETISNYYQRFILHNNDAKKRGRYLETLRLKTDVIYKSYLDIYDVVDIDEDVYKDLEGNNSFASMFMSQTTPDILTNRQNNVRALEYGNVIEDFHFAEQSFNDISRWSELTDGSFKQYAICIYSAGKLAIVSPKKKLTIDLKTMTKEIADQLVEKKVFYQLNATKYLINTTSGFITVEVR